MSFEFLWVSATILTFGTLALAGYRHLRDDGFLGLALHIRFGVARHTCARLARLIGCYELALGSSGLASTVVGQRVFLRILLGVALVTYALYTWYLSSLLGRGASVPCGCASDGAPANHGTLVRTLALASAAAFALLSLPTLPAASGAVLLMAALAGITFTTLLWSLPSAMAFPSPTAGEGEPTRGTTSWERPQ